MPALMLVPLPSAPPPLVFGNVLCLALASTALAYLLYFRLIATIGPARALTVNTLAGCALILGGTWVAARVRATPVALGHYDQGSA